MKIAFHVHSLGLGGAERQLYYLVAGLAAKGHEIHILTLHSSGQLEAEFRQLSGVIVQSFDRAGKFDFRCLYRLCQYLKSQEIQFIQGWIRPCNTFAALASAITGKPAAISIRQSTTASLGGSNFYLWLDRFITRHVSVEIVYNSYSGQEQHREWGFPQDKDRVIANGIDQSEVGPVQLPFSKYPPCRLGMLARIEPEKGHSDVIEALSRLKDTLPSLELHIFGEGDNDLINRLQGMATKLGVDEQIVWRGISIDCWSALNEIDVLVSASHTEGMSNAIMEAMLAARPILATDVGDTRRMLSDSNQEFAIIVPAKSPESLAIGIRSLIESRTEAVNLGLAAQSLCRDRYNRESMVSSYEQLYTKALGGV